MDKNKLAQRLMATFLEEMHEHIVNMNRDLLALEKCTAGEEREQLLKVLFRSAHSLKGASRVVNVDVIESACHRLEDLLDEIRNGKREFAGDLPSLFLRTIDAIEEVGTHLRTEQDLSDATLLSLLPLLDAAVANKPLDSQAIEPRTIQSTKLAAATPEPQPASTSDGSAKRTKPSNSPSVRVSAEKLDSLLAQSGELLVARGRVDKNINEALELSHDAKGLRDGWTELHQLVTQLAHVSKDPNDQHAPDLSRRTLWLIDQSQSQMRRLTDELTRFAEGLSNDSRQLDRTCRSLEKEVYRVRLLPFSEACGGLERIARDVAKASGKQVEFILQGEEVEVDRAVLEGLKDPLVHLVTNAIDHGIELPSDRRLRGKNELARICVSASLRGDQVEVVVEDDGQGIDINKIRAAATSRGLEVPPEDDDIARLVFSPGFSTLSTVTEVSGRGVGLDVVQSQIESLHGSVDVSFNELGTKFTLMVPLTLTTIRCLLVEAAGQTLALPTSSVRQMIRCKHADVQQVAGRDMLMEAQGPIALASLAGVFKLPKSSNSGDQLVAVILKSGEQEAAILVDQLVAEGEILVKNMGPRVRRVRHVAGATLLSSGEISLVLNVPSLLRAALGSDQGIGPRIVTPAPQTKKKLLVVDDSITIRAFMTRTLDYAGFDVQNAADGEEAWQLLQNNETDLVVSDVDMPNLDGFELTKRIRASSTLQHVPVILVTARSSDADKSRGLEVGADAYIAKSTFDQEDLIEAIEQLL